MKKKFLVILGIFLFSVVLRLWNLNQMGRTWDEGAQNIDGYHLVTLLLKGDFSNSYFYSHPYHPPLTKYIYGAASFLDVENWKLTVTPQAWYRQPEPTFRYDWTYSRLISVLFSSLTVVVVVFMGWRFLSPFAGVMAGFILSMLPLFVGYSQLVTIESFLIFFFTYSVYAFLIFLEKMSKRNILFCGVITGLAFLTKFTNVLVIPLLIWIFLLWHFHINGGNKHNLIKNSLKVLSIFLVALFVFLALWPMPWLHLSEFIKLNYSLRIVGTSLSVPGVFFGKLILLPKIYYLVMFLITTPVLVLIVFFSGLILIIYESTGKISFKIQVNHLKNKSIIGGIMSIIKTFLFFTYDHLKKVPLSKKRKLFYLYVFVIWFAFPFIQSLYNFRQQGIRYIIEIYAPLALISAFGFEVIVNKITKKTVNKFILSALLIAYLLTVLIRITPYYLDYFNVVVGGTKTVYEKRYFELGWWGQGLREMGLYLNSHAAKGSTVGLAVVPLSSVPSMPLLKTSEYKIGESYDYVAVSYFNIVREKFDDSQITGNYRWIYSVKADGAEIVKIYKRK
jgi:4-amino-4-deoxy-L-arabinose transferase-like glycosyltransferase